jgi:hypothetical protein
MRTAIAALVSLSLLPLSAQAKDPALGQTTFTTYEAYLSPAQEPGEESETPKPLQKTLGATAPSTPRAERKSKGHGQIRFTKDLSRAFVDVQIEGVNTADIVMFHIHCGPPGFLGPIIINFGEHGGSFEKQFVNGKMTVELTNKDVNFIKSPPTVKSRLPESCPIDVGFPSQASTLSGLEYLARKGVLYFNLHTKAHTYYGEMRGQIYSVKE